MGKCLFMRKGETHTAPYVGILAQDIVVGSSVYLNENGYSVEYLVVNQGIPENSSLYDSSCDGTWLLRKDIYAYINWIDVSSNNYKNSTIHPYLNNTFLGLFDAVTQEAIRQIKIPFVNGDGNSAVASGSNGLSAKIFLLGGYEVGWSVATTSGFPIDGACLSYFKDTAEKDSRRIAYFNGTVKDWWLRSPRTTYSDNTWFVNENGDWGTASYSFQSGVRPALIIPYNAVFDKDTLLLKGVA